MARRMVMKLLVAIAIAFICTPLNSAFAGDIVASSSKSLDSQETADVHDGAVRLVGGSIGGVDGDSGPLSKTIELQGAELADDASDVDGDAKTARFTAKGISFKATVSNTAATTDVIWDDGWFDESSYTYNHEMATTAAVLSAAAYCKESVIVANYDSDHLDFQDLMYFAPEDNGYAVSDGGCDQIGHSIATRMTADGKPVIVIAVRGTVANEEWLGNINIADSQLPNTVMHEGFKSASDMVYRSFLDYVSENEIDLDDARVLIAGHSRGAAVANILGYTLGQTAEVSGHGALTPDRVYTYTFESPTTTTGEDMGNVRYGNIFNIVNPEDIVTKLPLVWWGFGRYGKTLVLPSRSNTEESEYNRLKAQMNPLFLKYAGVSYAPYQRGVLNSSLITTYLANAANSTDQFYNTWRKSVLGGDYSLHRVAEILVRLIQLGEHNLIPDVVKIVYIPAYREATSGILALILGKDGPELVEEVLQIAAPTSLADIFNAIQKVAVILGKGDFKRIGNQVMYGHTQEMYVAWMQSASAERGRLPEIYRNSYRELKITCPVDVHVYDSSGKQVASIENDVVDDSLLEGGLPAAVADGVKYIDVPSDSGYRVVTTAREDGEMDFTVDELVGDGSQVVESKVYAAVPLRKGQAFELYAAANESPKNIVLRTGGAEAQAAAIYSGEVVPSATVAISAEGSGEVWGCNRVVKGTSTVVHARPETGSVFAGWYSDSRLLSRDADFNFRPEGDVAIVARFRAEGSEEESGGSEDKQDERASGSESASSGGSTHTQLQNSISVKTHSVKVKYSKLKKKKQVIKRDKAFSVVGAEGTVTFKKVSGHKKIAVSNNGKITVKKGLKKGTYKLKVKVSDTGSNSRSASSKTVTVKVVVR